jgi:hypothetical protein
MAVLTFPEWRPDVSDLNADYTRVLSNVVPRSDGYGPFKALTSFTTALPDTCRGYFAAREEDGTVAIFAGTSTNLYQLNNTTFVWDEVSKGGADYTELADGSNWVFAQFGSFVVAVQRNTVPQVFTLGSSSAFADLGGSPPQAGWASVVGPFLVLADLLEDPYRVQWSAIYDITGWTSGTDRSDFQDLPDLGRVRSVVEMSADVGLIMQEEGARRMIYQPGSAVIFRIDRLPDVPGILSPYSLVTTQGGAYYWSTRGFVRITADGSLTPIGEERVNRTVQGALESSTASDLRDLAYDDGISDNMLGAVDPERSIILWVYKSVVNANDYYDKGVLFHTTLNRFSPVAFNCQYLAQTAQPGLTLEALDFLVSDPLAITNVMDAGDGRILVQLSTTDLATIADGGTVTVYNVGGTTEANDTWTVEVTDGLSGSLSLIGSETSGFSVDFTDDSISIADGAAITANAGIILVGSTYTNAYTSGGSVSTASIDALEFSLDDISTATLPSIAAVGTDSKLGFFTGSALEATMETAEQALSPKRMLINGLWPVTDAATLYGSVVTRDTLHATSATEGTEGEMNDDGYVPLLDEGRYVRGRLRVPAETAWSFASGVEPDAMPGSSW